MKLHLLSASVLLAALPVVAQGPAGPSADPGPAMSRGFAHGFGFGHMRQPVTNAPYSATFTSTSTEKLQDGTVLTHASTRTVSRDSLGRTREELTFPAHGDQSGPRTVVTLFDPVARTVTQLHPDRKVAIVHAIPQPHGSRGEHDWAQQGAGKPSQGEAAGETQRNVAVADLGSKTLGGVLATGERVTRTIPANTMGNPAAIVITHEQWSSPDLKIELSRSDADPFRGTDSMTVSSLTKAEPDPALFRVPSDYTVQQAPQRAFGRPGQGNAPASPDSM